jgi:YggT family protein
MTLILNAMVTLLEVYFYLMIATILLTWFPEATKSKWYEVLYQITSPYLRIFRGVVVIGQFDFTPIIGFLVYQFGLNAFAQLVASMT